VKLQILKIIKNSSCEQSDAGQPSVFHFSGKALTHIAYLFLVLILLLAYKDNKATTLEITQNIPTQVKKSPYDGKLRQRIAELELKGSPFPADQTLPSINTPKAQLGKKLFFSKTLSGNMDTACASCHHPMLGGGDQLSLPIGAGSAYPDMLGRGRFLSADSSPLINRNSPTTFNCALWENAVFHDGRIQKLADGEISTPDSGFKQADSLAGTNLIHAQARFPVISNAEMKGFDFQHYAGNQSTRSRIAQRLGGYGFGKNELTRSENQYWLEHFKMAFPELESTPETLITEQNISEAISVYERSQVFIDTPWKRYIDGDNQAITEQQKQGALLFLTPILQGGTGCHTCHAGDKFTNELFYNVAVPQISEGHEANAGSDLGRFNITQKETDKYRFRTPSLLNVTETGPWGHNGAFTNLFDMVRHMLNPMESLKSYNPGQLQQHISTHNWQEKTQAAIDAGIDAPLQTVTDEKVFALVSFLNTLTDPCIKDRQCMQNWLPSEKDVDPMHLQLKAVSPNGTPL
jgi:cytochrome c peroxidase